MKRTLIQPRAHAWMGWREMTLRGPWANVTVWTHQINTSKNGAQCAQCCAVNASVCVVPLMQLVTVCSGLLKLCMKIYTVFRSLLYRKMFVNIRCRMKYLHNTSEPTKFERIHQIATIYVEFFFCSNVCVALVRQFVQLANHFFSATRFDHSLSEPCITNEPIVNAQELSFLTLLLELIRSVIFLISFLSVSVTVWSALPDVEVRNRKEVKNWLDVLLVLCRVIS